MIFRSPVTRPLHASGWTRPDGNIDFRVTQEFGCTGVTAEPKLGTCAHFHRGLDMGNGRCGDAVAAMAAGEVQFAGFYGTELMVILDHGGGWGTGYHHLSAATVTKGQQVTKGTKVGDIGKTGISVGGCHLHVAVKSGLAASWTKLDFIPNPFGGRGDSTGKWEDPWPLLEQNQPEDDMPLLSAYIPGHQATIGKGFNVRTAPATSGQVLRTLLAPETWIAFGWAKGELVAGSEDWLVRWAGKYEYVHRSGVTSVSPPDCTAAVKAATDPLIAERNALSASLTAAQAKLVSGLTSAKATVEALT